MNSIDQIRRFRKEVATNRWLIFGFFAAIYFSVYFHRVSTSVIVPDLLFIFQTQATALGFMNSMYFNLYAVEQPLVGFLADRFGPIRVVVLWTLIASCGCFLFGAAPTISWATVGRAFIGIGTGGVYVPVMKALSQLFNRKQFATLIGIILAVGNLGGIVATTPFAWIAHNWGWRTGFFIVGLTTLVIALSSFIFFYDRYAPSPVLDGKSRAIASVTKSSWLSILNILWSIKFLILGFIFFGTFGPYLTLQGLWATPFFMSLFGLDRLHASELNMLIPIGFILGAPIFGFIIQWLDRKMPTLMIALLAINVGIWAIIVFAMDSLEIVIVIPLLFLFGGTNGGLATVLWSIVREITPIPILGLTTGLLNPFVFAGAALLQIWTGRILDHTGILNGNYPPFAYAKAFMLCFLVISICLFFSICFRSMLLRKQ